MDAVRGGALLLGVVLHAMMSFFPDPAWAVVDDQRTPIARVSFFVIHTFRMSVFFLIAGFFGRMSYHRRGPGAFVADRVKRVAVPLVVAWPLLFVCVGVVGSWAVAHADGTELNVDGISFPTLSVRRFPQFHLWFLNLLLWLYAGALLLRAVIARLDPGERLRKAVDRALGALVETHLAPLLLAVPLVSVFFFDVPWIRWSGIRVPSVGLIPSLSAWVGFGTAFVFGWLLHRRIDLLSVWRRRWLPYLVVAIGLSVYCLHAYEAYRHTIDGDRLAAEALAPWTRLAVEAAYPLAIWTWTLAILGVAMAFLSGHSPSRRYVADASYWIYLVHLPLVMALQVAVSHLSLPWTVKLVAILAVTVALTLVTYHLFVRYTVVGAVLNGRRLPRPRHHATLAAPSAPR